MLGIYETLIQGLLDKEFGSVDNWLSNEELIGLRKSLLTYQENNFFHFAGVGSKDNLQIIKDVRSDQIHWLDPAKANLFEQQFFEKIGDFTEYLNRTCYSGIDSYEFQYAIYQKGSYYKKHIDQFRDNDKRRFSIVFYLTEDWQPGDGGELRLYTDNETIEIQPLPGRTVFFRSDLAHEVSKSNRERLSLTGWLKVN